MHRKIILGLLFIGFFQILQAAPVRNDYELTDEVAIGALEGWRLYKQGKTACRYNGGAYADQNLEFGGNQFWTNGSYARYDRDRNGHLETIFLMVGNDLEYVGSIGSEDRFIHTSRKRQDYLNQSFEQFIESYGEKSKQNAPSSFVSTVPSEESVSPLHDAKIAGDPALGKKKSTVCAACHMADGNSVNPLWPKLAGQHASYLVKQLKDFNSQARKDPIMSGQVSHLSDEEMYHFAAYYSSIHRKFNADQVDKKLSSAGKLIYENGIAEINTPGCIVCHGPAGMGNVARGAPLLAGQHAPYIEKQLKKFRNSAQRPGGLSPYGRSNDANHEMRQVLKRMTDSEISEVSHYIQGMKPK